MNVKSISAFLLCLCATVGAFAADDVKAYQGKAIYLPQDLKDNDFTDPESKWSFSRMACTENLVVFWAKGFGDNIGAARDLEDHDMKVDLANLLARLEDFYGFFYHDLAWVKPGTKADKYRMMVMLDYTLEGTAYGGSYDDVIGALWVTPQRVQDKRLNCIAHELGHSFQTQIWCDGEGVSWGGNGIFEMASQWMLWQVNPDWQTDEYYHLEAFRNLTHKAFLHIDNIYHSPYILEYWGDKHGRGLIAELFRQGTVDEDPAMTYMRVTETSQQQFCDEMFDASRRMVNWDYPRVWDNTRKYACQGWDTKIINDKGKYRPSPEQCPENYGFNVIPLTQPAGKRISVDFKGITNDSDYHIVNPDAAGWRYGFVAVDSAGNSHYSDMGSKTKGRLVYNIPEGIDVENLYLVVMGAPARHWRNIDGDENPGDAQWPYTFTLKGADVQP